MASYQKVEYRIGKDGKITELVIGATGETCTETTAQIEKALGTVSSQELLPEYYSEESIETTAETQSLSHQ